MKGIVAFFQDNAMFYKDITQWLRNKTFGSLFFGLLIIAEAISLLVIAGSDDISQPGVTMFYLLYAVLMVYALIIAFLGNGLTSREFMNRTFELYELSGMSLERMVGGKLISMIYQFAFGFFCLVPFMFFSYFLGGLDFFEMLMGTLLAWLLAVPLYLAALSGALIGRYKQITLLTRLASGFGMACLVVFIITSFFANEPFIRFIIKGISEVLKKILDGDFEALSITISVIVLYILVNLLLFYMCCNSISRETDSREIAIKGILTLLIIAWMGFFGVQITVGGYGDNVMQVMTFPVFLALLALGLVSYYNRLSVPPIVKRRYSGASPLRRFIYWLFQPGMRGGLRTILFLIVLVAFGGTAIVSTAPFARSGGSSDIGVDWWYSLSLLCQIPWFLTVPYLLYIRGKELRYNYPGQRALVMATWVILGILVTIFLAWKRSGIYNSGMGSASLTDALICVMLSPLSSLSIMGADNSMTAEIAATMRMMFGGVGVILMIFHLISLTREDARFSIEAEHASQEGTIIEENSGPAPEKVEG